MTKRRATHLYRENGLACHSLHNRASKLQLITFKIALTSSPCELPEGVRQRGQLVVLELQRLQLDELPEGVRQRGQIVVLEPQLLQVGELPEGVRQRGQLDFLEPHLLHIG